MMKKLFLMLAVFLPLFVFTGCSDDEESLTQSVLVNVMYDGTPASPSLVRLYDYEEASKCNFDYDAMNQYGDYRKLIDESGNEIKPKYTSDSTSGVNTFEDVENGKYILVVMYKPDGYSWPMHYFYGYKDIIVNQDTNANLYTIKFEAKSKRGEFTKF